MTNNGNRDYRDPVLRTAIARRLRALRRAFGASRMEPDLSQAGFARLLNIEGERYRRYERGDIEMGLTLLVEIRRVTGVSLDNLIAGEPPGNDRMVPLNGIEEGELVLGDRLRMVREILEPNATRWAKTMGVGDITWGLWELGAELPTLAKMEEFAHRSGVSLDFLYRGHLTGIADHVLKELLRLHPELQAAPPDENGNGRDKAVGSSGRRVGKAE